MSEGFRYRTPAELRALPHSGSETSAAAAFNVKAERAADQRARILLWLERERYGGMTDEELQEACDLDGDAERPRRWQLVRDGLVRDSGRKRKTSSGAQAIVWEVVPE